MKYSMNILDQIEIENLIKLGMPPYGIAPYGIW